MANLKTLNEIFNNTIYRIPDYQRGYAWTATQLNDFWDDIYNLSEDRYHYTGVLTIKEVPIKIITEEKWNEELWLIKERGYKAYHVVDGQQRLTTCIIFIQAMIETIQAQNNIDVSDSEIYLGSFSLKEIKETFLLVKKPPHGIIKTYKFGYESDNPSFKYLRYRIFNEENSGSINETFYTLNLENSKRFFKDKLKGLILNAGIEGIAELFRKLTVNIKFNIYDIEEDFDVFVAFETMNNRGKKLSNLELLKNRLIYLTTLYNETELKYDDRIALRNNIDDAWKEVYFQLGRNKTQPLNDDDFLNAHWIVYFHYTRQKGDDYINYLLKDMFNPKNIFEKKFIPVSSLENFEEIRENDEELDESIENEENEGYVSVSKLTPLDIEDYIQSLKAASVHWYNSFNPIGNRELPKNEQIGLDRLNRIGIAYFRPLVIASYLNETVTLNERVKLFKEIERFIFIAFRMKGALSSYRNNEFYKAAKQLYYEELNVQNIIEKLNQRLDFAFNYFDENDENSARYYDITVFKKSIDKHFQNGGGFYWWNSLRYFLFEYEVFLAGKDKRQIDKIIEWNTFTKNEKDRISIEHVLPQSIDKKCWKDTFKGYSKKEINNLQGTLGNLVPLSGSINSSLQNDCFVQKKSAKIDDKGNRLRQGYNDGSHSEIEISIEKEWNADLILQRGLRLLNFMEERWNIKFKDDTDKIKMLGLDFMISENM